MGLSAELPSTETLTGPASASLGTVTVRLLGVTWVTVPLAPANRTSLWARSEGSNPEPLTVTLVPGSPSHCESP
ncbi:hypothetical protein D3C86_1098130 [compost metagenome]